MKGRIPAASTPPEEEEQEEEMVVFRQHPQWVRKVQQQQQGRRRRRREGRGGVGEVVLLLLLVLSFVSSSSMIMTVEALVAIPRRIRRPFASNSKDSNNGNAAKTGIIGGGVGEEDLLSSLPQQQQRQIQFTPSPMTTTTATKDEHVPDNSLQQKEQQHQQPSSKPPPTLLTGEELNPYTEYETLRSSQLDDVILSKFFQRRPHLIAKRFLQIFTTLTQARKEWESSPPSKYATTGFADGYLSDEGVTDEEQEEVLSGEDDRGVQLCNRLSSLGPVAVKLCQTLSQRPDLVGNEMANAFKRLQTRNIPFTNELAWSVLKQSLDWKGPVAPGGIGAGGDDTSDKPLFVEITPNPIATASLGQVYKATTHEGKTVAVKIQRPDGMSILAQDAQCFRIIFTLLTSYRKIFEPKQEIRTNIGEVINRVARDVYNELNYVMEASNGEEFQQSLEFLGFVTTPEVIREYSTERVLVTEWVDGHHLDALESVEQGLLMTRMAVEACTASMVLTGFVHADPHQGNLMLSNDGKIVFLDFGLMTTVDQKIMESFARGIQACLVEDWTTLTQCFKDTGFITDPVIYRENIDEEFRVYGVDETTGEDLGLPALAKDLGDAMKSVEGGTSRFGALATVLNQEISPKWQLFTPPYVLLLIRTFLTLEGIAAQVDPDFNIYEMAMPWAVRRSLSPATTEGVRTLRGMLLDENNCVQWDRLLEVASGAKKENNDDAAVATGAVTPASAKEEQSTVTTAADAASTTVLQTTKVDVAGVEGELQDALDKAKANKSAKQLAMKDAVGSLLGSPDGNALRRALIDLDSTDLIAKLASSEAKGLRRAVASALSSSLLDGRSKRTKSDAMEVATASQLDGDDTCSVDIRPVSQECLILREKQDRWKRKVMRLLLRTHLVRQIKQGRRGLVALASLGVLSVKMAYLTSRIVLVRALSSTAIGSRLRRRGCEEVG